jgi:hypothetical protein
LAGLASRADAAESEAGAAEEEPGAADGDASETESLAACICSSLRRQYAIG